MPDTVATTATYDNLLTSLENHEIKVIKGGRLHLLTGIVKFEILSPFETEEKFHQCSVVILCPTKILKCCLWGMRKAQRNRNVKQLHPD